MFCYAHRIVNNLSCYELQTMSSHNWRPSMSDVSSPAGILGLDKDWVDLPGIQYNVCAVCINTKWCSFKMENPVSI